MKRLIDSTESALAYLTELDAGAKVQEIEFSGELAQLAIWINGPKYHASIPGELARGLWEYQEAIYKASAYAFTGSDDIRRLTADQREHLELVFALKEGSTDLAASLTEFLAEIAKGITSMSELNRIRLILILALIFGGGILAWKALDVSGENKKEEIKKELAITLEAEKTKQFEVFSKAIQNDPIIQRFEKAAEDGTKAIVRSATDATEIRIGRTSFDADDIKEITQRAPRSTSTADVVEGKFRVFSAELRVPGVSKYILSTAGTGEFPVSINESDFSQDDLEMIWLAIRSREEIKLEVNITKNKGVIKTAQIISVL